jgi:putative endonuclease
MYVYILYSEISSRYYTGQTADIDKRLVLHNQGNVVSTKNGIPWKLVLQILVASRTEAMILEKKIKKRGARRFIEDNTTGLT